MVNVILRIDFNEKNGQYHHILHSDKVKDASRENKSSRHKHLQDKLDINLEKKYNKHKR